jgi:UDP-perosamine 4-acetyltransferase
MPTEPSLLIVGVGGHGRVVADAWLAANPEVSFWGFDDADRYQGGVWFAGAICQGRVADAAAHLHRAPCHVAIGDNALRARFAVELGLREENWVRVVHPRGILSPHARVGAGSLICAVAVVAPGATVGQGVIVNHAAVVDHDVVLGDFCHIAPGAILGGGVHIGARALIGAGAKVLPGVHICDDAVIGAGAVVVRDVETARIWRGVPAREH